MTTARIINVGDRQWIAGLVWRSFADRPKLAELREDAKDLGAHWVAVRGTSQVIQAGFCPAVESDRPKRIFSLAAAIAQSQEQPWLGIYQLSDDLWWYLAVRDGQAVLPDGDVVGSYETILEARQRHENYADWKYLKGTLGEDLLPILEAARGSDALVPVRSVEPVSPWRVILPGIAAMLVVAGGVWLWHRHVEAVERHRMEALAAERARILAEQKAVSPLLSSPSPDQWLAACAAAIGPVNVSDDGWVNAGIACGATSATVTWKRDTGATVAQRPSGALSGDGNSVVQSIAWPALPHGADDAQGLVASDNALYALLQPLGVQAQISAPPAPPRLPGSTDTTKPPPIPAQSVAFTLPVAPFGIGFDQVPGLRLTFLLRKPDGWSIQGMIYGR
ncbi:MAG: type 4b pilus protein PilO2 [Acidiphilium sp.]|nr:type 4b pilus protein PilO2 [Acidiphilium sp.]